ncbi:hypothetical protein SPD48_03390 [Pseudogracilibacillus sp. SE30717A]|uniref:hypothetical protein n=1 Tax=Pseudogracilibacillus sp. SE30717A TaxID=3098293 RepID=UPI00300E5CC3
MTKKLYILTLPILIITFLSGCLYPQNDLAKNQMPNEAQLDMVQSAVLQYKEQTNGLVPIKTKENDVDIYEKYLIDFSLLKDNQLISEIPGTAYENGGIYQYTIVTPEDDPKVKLIDLRVTEKIREVYVKLDIYRSKNIYPPFGEQIDTDIYKLNYKKLGYKSEPHVISPFTKVNLPLLINTDGDIFIDYRIDLQQALNEFDHNYKNGDDIRPILENNYPFVPAYSLPYTIENNEPVFLIE